MLMIHLGPLISGAQALSTVATDVAETQVMLAGHQHQPYSHAAEHVQHPDHHVTIDKSANHSVDYHALMGHHSASAGTPEWLANLAMCGYCELLTVSPGLVLTLLIFFAFTPPILRFTALLLLLIPLVSAYSISHPRAPPKYLFA